MYKRQLQPALREWRDHMTAPLTLLVFGAVSIVLAIVVPFGAGSEVSTVARFGYLAQERGAAVTFIGADVIIFQKSAAEH